MVRIVHALAAGKYVFFIALLLATVVMGVWHPQQSSAAVAPGKTIAGLEWINHGVIKAQLSDGTTTSFVVADTAATPFTGVAVRNAVAKEDLFIEPGVGTCPNDPNKVLESLVRVGNNQFEHWYYDPASRGANNVINCNDDPNSGNLRKLNMPTPTNPERQEQWFYRQGETTIKSYDNAITFTVAPNQPNASDWTVYTRQSDGDGNSICFDALVQDGNNWFFFPVDTRDNVRRLYPPLAEAHDVNERYAFYTNNNNNCATSPTETITAYHMGQAFALRHDVVENDGAGSNLNPCRNANNLPRWVDEWERDFQNNQNIDRYVLYCSGGVGAAHLTAVDIIQNSMFAPKSGSGLAAYGGGDDDGYRLTAGIANVIPEVTPTSSVIGTGVAGDQERPLCYSSGYVLSWIICPIYEGLAAFSDWLLDWIRQFMEPERIGLDPGDEVQGVTYRIWSSFRLYGNIILVILLLVAVFGQAISGGLTETYTTRKMLPRILVSAILINTSIYIVAFGVDLSRIVGNGIGDLLRAPLIASGDFQFTIRGGEGFSITAILLAVGGLATAIGATFAGLLPIILVFLALPAAITMLGIVITIILLQGLIIGLGASGPIAFAFYPLSNTEKYTKLWWDWFFRALLVFVIFMVIVALSDLMSVFLSQAGDQSNTVVNGFALILGFFAQLLPLFLIPFSFSIAGGLVGRIYSFVGQYGKQLTEFIKGNPNDPTSMQSRARHAYRDAAIQSQARRESSTREGSWLRRTYGTIMSAGGGGRATIQERISRANAEDSARTKTIVDSGDDTYVKGATLYAVMDSLRNDPTRFFRAGQTLPNGNIARENTFIAPDGSPHTERNIRTGYAAYGRNHAIMQEGFKYMLGKAAPSAVAEQNRIIDDYIAWANDQGLDRGTAIGRLQGFAIPLQNVRMDLRRVNIDNATAADVTAGRAQRVGQLIRGGTNDAGLLIQASGTSQYEWTQQSEGTYAVIRDALYRTANGVGGGRFEDAAKTYANVLTFAEGAEPPPGAAAAVAAAAAAGGAGAPGAATYASSSGAAAKNREAAREMVREIRSIPNPRGPGSLHDALMAEFRRQYQERGRNAAFPELGQGQNIR